MRRNSEFFVSILQPLCISLLPLIFPYSAQILLENALFCRQNARLKNRLFKGYITARDQSKVESGVTEGAKSTASFLFCE